MPAPPATAAPTVRARLLEVGPSNIRGYACGARSLVDDDLRAVLGESAGAAAGRALDRAGLAGAFAMRREVVNLKKARARP